MNTNIELARGMIFMVNFGEREGSIQSGYRPAVVITNKKGCKFSPVIMVCPITTKTKRLMPTHVDLHTEDSPIKYESTILTEQAIPVNKSNLTDDKYIGRLNDEYMLKLDKALEISFEVGTGKFEISDNTRERKIAQEKADRIKELDSFIKVWLDRKGNVSDIYDIVEDRTVKLKELEKFCNIYNLSFGNYYTLTLIKNDTKLNRMVG